MEGNRRIGDYRMRLHPLAPVVALDIDGTLGDYYNHFKWFAELYMQEKLSVKWDIGGNGSPSPTNKGEFSEALGLSKEVYRDIKLAYRQGGMKRSLPQIDLGVEMLVKDIRSMGIQVWICTTRPWQRLDNIDPDTQFWIHWNLGRVDGVIYGEDKYLDLMDIVGKERILGVVDDLPENVETAARIGLHSALRVGDHNRWWRIENPTHPTALHSADILEHVTKWHNIWKESHK